MTIAALPDERFWTSLSAAGVFQDCEQKYYNSYVRKLRPRERFVPFALGNMIHDYVEQYWQGIKDVKTPEDAHVMATFATSAKYIKELKGYAQAAFNLGNLELAEELNEMPAKAGRIIERYFIVRGRDDGERYEPLLVEQSLHVMVAPGILSNGKLDCVTRDRADGVVHLWENKTAKTIPSDSFRMRDFQTVLYDSKLRAANFDKPIDHIMWNYLRSVEPDVPEVIYKGTKREGLSRAKTIDTTWGIYAKEIKRLGYDERAYSDMEAILTDKEERAFFPRFDIPIVVDKSFLMANYVHVSEEMRRKTSEWSQGLSVPIMHLSWNCDRCEMYRLCMAKLTGGDQDDLIQMYYEIGKGGF